MATSSTLSVREAGQRTADADDQFAEVEEPAHLIRGQLKRDRGSPHRRACAAGSARTRSAFVHHRR